MDYPTHKSRAAPIRDGIIEGPAAGTPDPVRKQPRPRIGTPPTRRTIRAPGCKTGPPLLLQFLLTSEAVISFGSRDISPSTYWRNSPLSANSGPNGTHQDIRRWTRRSSEGALYPQHFRLSCHRTRWLVSPSAGTAKARQSDGPFVDSVYR